MRNKVMRGSMAAALTLMAVSGVRAADAPRVVDLAEKGNATAVAAAIKQGGDANLAQPDGATALHWAAHWNDLALTKQLLAAGAKSNVANDYGVTPLLVMAANGGSAEIADALLTAGADANAKLPSGQTVLMSAVRGGNVATVKRLLKAGANVNAVQASKGQNALMWAVSEGRLDVVEALIAGGADVHARSKGGFTALMGAAREGNLEIAKVLLAAGDDIEAAASDGTTPLVIATVRGHADLAMFLLEKGAKPDAAFDKAGYTPLHWAAGTFDPIGITYRGIDPPGEWASYSGIPNREKKLQLIKSLLAHGADVNAKAKRTVPALNPNNGTTTSQQKAGATPFFVAAAAADPEVMRLLLANGADPLIRANDGSTAIIVACEGIADNTVLLTEDKRIQAIQVALDTGEDIEGADSRGLRAMHIAARAGFHDIIKYLLSKGADINPLSKPQKGGSGLIVFNLEAQSPLGLVEGTLNGIFYERPATADFLRGLGAKSIGRFYPHAENKVVPPVAAAGPQ